MYYIRNTINNYNFKSGILDDEDTILIIFAMLVLIALLALLVLQ